MPTKQPANKVWTEEEARRDAGERPRTQDRVASRLG